MRRLQINLTSLESRALGILAERELRDPRDQIRAILREEFQRQGLVNIKDGEIVMKEDPKLKEVSP